MWQCLLVPIHEREYFKDYETLYSFLLKVPILDTFYNSSDKIIDSVKLKKYILRNKSSKGIRLLRRYYTIIARK